MTARAQNQEQPRWTRLAALGLVLAAAGPVLMFLAAILWGLDVAEQAPFFLGTAAIALVAAFLVSRFGVWAKIVGVVASVLVAMALFWTAFGLMTPASFFDFMPGALVIPGALLAIVSCIAAIVAGRRGNRTASAVAGERNGIRIALAVVAVLAVVSGVLTLAGRTSADASGDVTRVDLTDFDFDQSEYTVEGGTTVLVRNTDPFLHTFTVDALDINVALTPGSEKTIEIPDEPGDYIVYCIPHTFDPKNPEDDDMVARLRVT